MAMDLHKKLSLVTGSTSGIGLSIANALAKAGSDVIITGLGDTQTTADIARNIERKYNVKAEYIGADLQNVSEIKTLISEVLRRHPEGIDILINNAGVHSMSPVEDTPDDCWDRIMAVNLSAAFQLIKGFLPGMKKKRWGRIVNTSSILGQVGFLDNCAYSASKHGIIGLNKCVALECADYGITCNAICPTLVDTQLGRMALEHIAKVNGTSTDEEKAKLTATSPAKQMLLPEQVAELVLFIVASGASNQMTGGSYLLDGGYTAQ